MAETLEMWRIAKVAQAMTLSRTMIWRLQRAGQFPRPADLYRTVVAWDSTKVMDWLRLRPDQTINSILDKGSPE